MGTPSPSPRFFRSPAEFRKWLAKNHAAANEIVVGYWKKGVDRPTMTWPESVDEALCYGWIDGVRKSLSEESYQIRFTPRKPTSHWSLVNVKKMDALREQGKMTPAGERAFAARTAERTGRAAYEQPPATLSDAEEKAFKKNKKAWTGFHALAPSYQRTALRWIVSAKKPETRARRLAQLVEWSAKGEVLPQYRWQKGGSGGSPPDGPS